MERNNISLMRNPYAKKLREDREADYSRAVYKNIPALVVATLVALPIAFFILTWIVDQLVNITQIINNL